MYTLPARSPAVSAWFAGALLLAACDTYPADPPDTIDPASTYRLTIIDGDGQVTLAGSLLPLALAVSVTDSGGNGVAERTIHWQAEASGGGSFEQVPGETLHPAVTRTDQDGVARVYFRPFSFGPMRVTAVAPGVPYPRVIFTGRATENVPGDPGVVVIAFGFGFFECGSDPSRFVGPTGSTTTVGVGTPVEWAFSASLHDPADGQPQHDPDCTALLTSTSVPPGGEAFTSGIMRSGERFRFVPGVPGSWRYADSINGGTGTLEVVAQPPL